MPATPLGPDVLKVLLAGHGHLLLTNRTQPEDGVTIMAAAIARHLPGGSHGTEAVFHLGLEADESVGVDPVSPLDEAPETIEAMLRLHIAPTDTVVDAYVVMNRPSGEPSVTFEAGVKRNTGVVEEGEHMLEGFPHIVVYGTPTGEEP